MLIVVLLDSYFAFTRTARANDVNLQFKLFLSKETCPVNIVSNENHPYYNDRSPLDKS